VTIFNVTSYEDGNKLEDTVLEITNVSPDDTPLMTMVGKTKAKSTLHQWPIDALSNYTVSSQLEGGAFTFTTVNTPTRVTNTTQRITQTWAVSRDEMDVSSAGITNQYEYYKSKAKPQLATSMELALLAGTIVTSSATAAGQMRGLLNFATTNLLSVATGTLLAETSFIYYQQLSWTNASFESTADKCFVGAGLKKAITSFIGNTTRYDKASEKRLINNVLSYEGPFGIVDVVTHRIMPANIMPFAASTINAATLLLFRENGVKMAVLSPVRDIPADVLGGGVSGKLGGIDMAATLEQRKEPAMVVVTGFNNT